MSDTVIRVENLSKQYRLGKVGTGSLAHDLNRTWHRVRGKEDPYLKIGEANDRSVKGNSEYVWALQDINFEVKQGEVLGIIGRNGAGKSTLLKILSRTTTPTTGSIKIKGRIASLLEVGTGFHPELSGRENIFLNGAILGMTRQEIKRKFDEIVDFAGVERYIDTPVKRYSSGMYVRLAFGVAAHLEPEILIVDEVLAVGDAEFQKKAIGKMKDVSAKDGRTVIFVSHNMNSIARLCTKGLVMQNGRIVLNDNIDSAITKYIENYVIDDAIGVIATPVNSSDKEIQLLRIAFENERNQLIENIIGVHEIFNILLKIELKKIVESPKITFHFKNKLDEFVLFSDMRDASDNLPSKPGIYYYKIKIPQPLLKPDIYTLSVGITNEDTGQTNHFANLLKVEIVDYKGLRGNRAGYIYIESKWELVSFNENEIAESE